MPEEKCSKHSIMCSSKIHGHVQITFLKGIFQGFLHTLVTYQPVSAGGDGWY